jgi:nucleoside-diphosphate-sugar epimerase
LKKNILIAGGTGFIGFHLAKKLKKLNFNVTCLSHKKPTKNRLVKNIHYLVCDVKKYNDLKKKLNKRYDYVFNFSGNIDHSNKLETQKTHYKGCQNLVKLFLKKKINLFVQVGSSLEYGKLNSPQKENQICRPVSFYGKSKLMASQYLKQVNKKSSFPFVVLRLYQIYGPKQKFDRLIPNVIKSCLKNQKFKCTEGTQKRDFLYIDDLINLLLKIMKTKKIKSGVYNVGSGSPTQIKFIINCVIKKIKKGKPLFGKIKMRKDEIANLYPDVTKIKNNFKWKAKLSIIKGLHKTIKSYKI